jgi:hypothetical protein
MMQPCAATGTCTDRLGIREAVIGASARSVGPWLLRMRRSVIEGARVREGPEHGLAGADGVTNPELVAGCVLIAVRVVYADIGAGDGPQA